MTRTTIRKWGNSLGLKLPEDAARTLAIGVGVEVEILARKGELVVRPVARKLTLAGLFRGKTSAQWGEFYRGSAVDWGPDVGREIIEE